jgi:hypothetical protein
MPARPARLTVALLAAATLAASACGSVAKSGGSAPASTRAHTPALHLTGLQIAQRHVAGMVLAAGSLPGYTLHSKGAETLKEQLPPKGAEHAAETTRLVTATWLASAHSFILAPDGKLYVFSDANLFRSSAAAVRVNQLEQRLSPRRHVRLLPAPGGAPAGAHLAFVRNAKVSAFTLAWTQGPVIAYVRIYGRAHETFTRVGERRIAAFLTIAANAQAARIAHVEAAGNRSA